MSSVAAFKVTSYGNVSFSAAWIIIFSPLSLVSHHQFDLPQFFLLLFFSYVSLSLFLQMPANYFIPSSSIIVVLLLPLILGCILPAMLGCSSVPDKVFSALLEKGK